MALIVAALVPQVFLSAHPARRAHFAGASRLTKEDERLTGQPLPKGASAEQRYRALLDRRDLEARHGQEARGERDLIQSRRRELIDASRDARARRDPLCD